MDSSKFTFLHGIRGRSGTNYISKIISYHPDIQLVPPGQTTVEFPLLRFAPQWEIPFDQFVNRFNSKKKDQFRFSGFAAYLGNAWLNYIEDLFTLDSREVLLKDPSVKHINNFFEFFPKSKLVILVRDGRDNVSSAIKRSHAVLGTISRERQVRNKISNLILWNFINHSSHWAKSAKTILRFDEQFQNSPFAKNYIIIRYEDMYLEPRKTSQQLFQFMGVNCNDDLLTNVENADVVGSSFYNVNQVEDATKPNWTPTPKNTNFNPVGRWQEWGKLKKMLFKRVAGKELIALNYEDNNDW